MANPNRHTHDSRTDPSNPSPGTPEETRPASRSLEDHDEAVRSFEECLRGDLVLPEAAEYDETRQVWNGLVDKHPAMIVRCANTADVSEAMAFAREYDLRLSVRGGGHHESGSAIAENGLVVDCSGMDHIGVDPDAQTVRVGPGVRAGELHAETQQFGLAAPTGSADDIGIAGSTLDGGIGWLRRKHGLGIDALRSVEIVTADGAVRTASPEQNPGLFWAVRGGGGNVGIVTDFEFDLYEIGPEVMTVGVFYPVEHAVTVLQSLRAVMSDASDALTTFALYGHVPPLPPIPEDLHGIPAVGILGCYAGSIEDGEAAVAPLREIAEPLVDLSGPLPYLALHEMGSAMLPEGRNYCWRSSFVDELTDDLIDRVIEGGSAAPSPLSSIEMWPLGGEMGRVAPEATAFPWRDAGYLLTVASNWEGSADEANIQWARETDAAFRELGAEGAYAGFPGIGGTDEDVAGMVYSHNYGRLAAIKDRYDPSNDFRENVTVDPAAD